jgi:Tfp pilus assembly protein PilN
MRAVNLLPRELDELKAGPSRQVVVSCAGAVLAMAVLAGGYMQGSSTLATSNAALTDAQARLAAIPQPMQQPASVTGLPQQRQSRVAALSSALTTRVAWDRVLREVSLVVPDDVWLSSLQAAAPTAAGITGQGIHLTGFTYSQPAVARLLARLTVIPDLQRVSLTSSTQTEIGSRSVVQFEIGADLKPAGATAASAPIPAAPTS